MLILITKAICAYSLVRSGGYPQPVTDQARPPAAPPGPGGERLFLVEKVGLETRARWFWFAQTEKKGSLAFEWREDGVGGA